MRRKAISLLIIGAITSSVLTGCNSKTDEATKEGIELSTEIVEQDNESNTNTDENSNISAGPSEGFIDESIVTLPKDTYVREVKDGYIKEIQYEDGASYYKVAWGNEEVTGTQTDLLLEFKSMQNIGSWSEENPDSGVWRYIDEDKWFTTAIWCGGCIPESGNKLLKIDETSIDDIKELVSSYMVYEDTIEMRKSDKYVAATMKVDRVDAGLSGYITILDDNETSFRWIIQFLMLSESADFDLLKETAKSVCTGTDFTRETLKEEAEISEKPYTVNTVDN